MSSKAIREYDAKLLLAYWLERAPNVDSSAKPITNFAFPAPRVAQVSWDPQTNTITPETRLPSWVSTTKLVVKPDQLIKRRGKAGLLALNKTWEEAKEWITARAGKPQKASNILLTGTLSNFILEPFLPHPSSAEYYVCITSQREGDTILFTHEGGVDIGDVDAKALKLDILVGKPFPNRDKFAAALLKHVPPEKQDTLVDFLLRLYSVYVDLHFAYLEINPLVCLDAATGGQPTIHYLDMAAKLDQTADSICGPKWAIARDLSIYESAAATQSKGVSADRGPPMVWPAPFGRDLTKEEAYIQKLDGSTGASLKLTVLNPEGRIWTMVAGGGASVVYSDAIAAHGFAHELANYGEYSGAPTEGQTYEYAKTIGGRFRPNHSRQAKSRGQDSDHWRWHCQFHQCRSDFQGHHSRSPGVQDTLINHQVRIYVRRGGPNYQEGLKAMRLLGESLGVPIKVYGPETHITEIVPLALGVKPFEGNTSSDSTAVGAIQPDGGRSQPNDQIVRFETSPNQSRPSYRPFDATTRSFVYGLQPRAIQGMLDFDYSCGRETPSVAAMIYPFGGHHIQKFYWGTKETLLPVYTSVDEAVKKHPDVDVVVNFASSRSVYSNQGHRYYRGGCSRAPCREILHVANHKNVHIIGPATVGGIKPGCFKIGNSGGMMDNIIASKLYRPGSVGYVSKSGGMSNELNNILSLYTNGTYEGIAIGGDRYPGTTFIDHLLRYEEDPECKLLVLLGEVGGIEEYRVIEAVKEGKIKKLLLLGLSAPARKYRETADAKNRAMREAGFIVPETLKTYLKQGSIKPAAEQLGLIRKPAAFISTISDERGQELIYAGMRISDVFKEDIGLGGVVSLLWFKRRLPLWATNSSKCAMNTIVATRAGKDLISSLASGLLTIGSRFGGALDEAAAMFSVSGIGHKIKSVSNPDLRVQLVKEYVQKHFPSHSLLDYALAVEKVTTSKKDTLILNVDGCIAVCFVDLLRDSGAFNREEQTNISRSELSTGSCPGPFNWLHRSPP
ncbi:ATP-citrate synthase [Russula vinacea]|nr:ATP-citrate synthase [Russula vinacea]